MKEQSHKDEMSAALRGDFDRLRERGVSVALAPVEHPGEPESEVVPDVPEVSDRTIPARRGWRDRLLGR